MTQWQWRGNKMALIRAISEPSFACKPKVNATYCRIRTNLKV